MKIYAYQESWGFATNLQLYSLRQAYKIWKYLNKIKDNLSDTKILEICVFITATLGLSLSQLLGQNYPGPHSKEGLPPPKELFKVVMRNYAHSQKEFESFKSRFEELINFYDASRHFGLDKDKKRHDKVAALTIKKTEEFLDTTFEIWDRIIQQKDKEMEYDNIQELLEALEDLEEDEIQE